MKKLYLSIQILLLSTCMLVVAQQPFDFIGTPKPSQGSTVSSKVNLFTGKIGLSVPIYNYSSASSSLNYNISLDYSSGGINLNQDPSSVGTGWNLNAGGMIHRTINGMPDDLYRTSPSNYNTSGYFYTPAINDNLCSYQYRAVGYYTDPDNKVVQDSEPDEFQFNFLGKQGSFIIPKNSSFTGGPVKVLTKPQSNLDVQLYATVMPFNIKTDIGKIVITDDNGIQYWFTELQLALKKNSKVIKDSSKVSLLLGTQNFYHYEYDHNFEYYVTDWALTKIIDLNSKEEINLEYEYFFGQFKSPEVLTSYVTENGNTSDYFWDNRNILKGDQKRIKAINFSNGDKVNFEYSSNPRCDFLSDKALQKVLIKNSSGNEIEYGLNYVYYKGNTEIDFNTCISQTIDETLSKWLFLKSVSRNVLSSSIKIAEFEYNRSSDKIALADPFNNLPTRKTIDFQDLFGYYNGPTIKNCLDPNKVYKKCPTNPSAGYTEIGSLKKVVYPTGGSSTFEYDGNSIVENGVEKPFYGVRIKRIIENDGISISNDNIKEYKYILDNTKSSGFAMPLPPNAYNNEMNFVNDNKTKSYNIKSTFFVLSPININGSPVGYSKVEETNNLGKVINEFTSFTDQAPINTSYTYPFANKDRTADWTYGLLKKQSVLDKLSNIVKTTENTYNSFVNTISLPDYKAMKTAFQKEVDGTVFGQSFDPVVCAQTMAFYKFKYDIYYPITGRSELKSTTEKNYLKDGSVLTSSVQYEYDPNTYNLKKITSNNSANEKLEKILFYPTEYLANSSTYKLTQRSIKSLPVSSISILTKPDNTKYISGFEKTDFYFIGDNSIRSQRSFTMKSKNLIPIAANKTIFTPEENYGEATTKLTENITYDKYDNKGKAIQTTAKKITQSVIWDNTQNIIIAKSNAPVNDIAFTSFETTEKGNWEFTGDGIFEISSLTGKKCYNLTANSNLKKINLTVTKAYIISYWSKNGSYLVNGAAPFLTGTAINGWIYCKHRVTNALVVTITGNGYIDELRIHPENAQMTSVTFEPLIGLTSESGIDGQITKYEYDSFGRLLSIKDEFGNVSKVFCYTSKGLTSSCGDVPVFKNYPLKKTFFNQTCPGGTVSDLTEYAVPQGRYVSFISQEDADMQASKEAETFGQAIANKTPGACKQITIYAKLSYQNAVSYGASTYADVVVKFYSDPTCSNPVYVNNLAINYKEWFSNGGETIYNAVANGFQTTLFGSAPLYYEEYECDYGDWPCYYKGYSYEYYLAPNPNYQIVN